MALRESIEEQLKAYSNYACSDALRFVGNIGLCEKNTDGEIILSQPDDYVSRERRAELVKKVLRRLSNLQDIDKQIEGSAVGATMGSRLGYSEQDIEHVANTVNLSHSGVCTTFALAGADAVLRMKREMPDVSHEIQRVEILAKPAGHRGTHCYVVVNREMNSQLDDVSTWGNRALVVDPWLASLQNPVVYSIDEFSQTGFLDGRLEVNFDTSSPNLAAERRERINQADVIRKAFKKCIDDEDTVALATLFKETPDFEDIILGAAGLNIFTYAISHHKKMALYTLLDNMPDRKKFINQNLHNLLKYAIENQDFDFFKYVLNNGVQLKACSWLIYDAFNLAREIGDIRFFKAFFDELRQYDEFDEDIRTIGFQIPLLQQKYPNLVFPYLLSLTLRDVKNNIHRAESEYEIYSYTNNMLEHINETYQKQLQLVKLDDEKEALRKVPESKGIKPDWRTPPPLPKGKLLFSKQENPNERAENLRKERNEALEALAIHVEEKFGYELPVKNFANVSESVYNYEVMLKVLHDYVCQHDGEKSKLNSEKMPVSTKLNRIKCSLINDEVNILLSRYLESLASLRNLLDGAICDENGRWIQDYSAEKLEELRIKIDVEGSHIESIKTQREAALREIQLAPEIKSELGVEVTQKLARAESLFQDLKNRKPAVNHPHKPQRP